MFNIRQAACNGLAAVTVKHRVGSPGKEGSQGGRVGGDLALVLSLSMNWDTVVHASWLRGFIDHTMFCTRAFTVLGDDSGCLWTLMGPGGPVAVSRQSPNESEVFFLFMKSHFLSIKAEFLNLLAFSWQQISSCQAGLPWLPLLHPLCFRTMMLEAGLRRAGGAEGESMVQAAGRGHLCRKLDVWNQERKGGWGSRVGFASIRDVVKGWGLDKISEGKNGKKKVSKASLRTHLKWQRKRKKWQDSGHVWSSWPRSQGRSTGLSQAASGERLLSTSSKWCPMAKQAKSH